MERVGKLLAIISFLFLFSLGARAQGTSTIVRHGSTLPATCSSTAGEIFFKTSAPIGLHQCTSANTWTYAGGVNGLTTGSVTKAASANSVSNSLCDEGITTANVLTCTNTGGMAIPKVATGSSPPTCTNGTGGAVCLKEGSAATAEASSVVAYADSTEHALKASFNNDAFSQLARFVDMGQTYNHSGTKQASPHIVIDTCTLGTDCAVTLTGSAVFTSSTSYVCVVQDDTAAAATKVVQSSGSAFTITGTGTDVLRYICLGN